MVKKNNKSGNYIKETQTISGEPSKLVWSNVQYQKGGKRELTKEESEFIQNSSANGKLISGSATDDGTFDIWKRMNSGTTMQGMNGQGTMESLQQLRPGMQVGFYDFEVQGTPGHVRGPESVGWYSPTELAIQRTVLGSDYTAKPASRGLSLFLRPTVDEQQELWGLISKIKSMRGKGWSGLSKDEWRSANDLILYAHEDPFNSKSGIFRSDGRKNGRNKLVELIGQNRAGQAIGTPDNPSPFTNEHIKRMELGLKNRINHGTSPNRVALELVKEFRAMGPDGVLGGFNINIYDNPTLIDYINSKLIPNVTKGQLRQELQQISARVASGKHLDVRQAVSVGYVDKGTRFATKNLTQEEILAQRGLSTGTAHVGIDDVGGVRKLWNNVVQSDGIMDVAHGTASYMRTATFNKTAFKVGDTLFSMHGIASNQMGKWDNIYEMNSKGVLAPTGTRQINPLFKSTEYTLHSKGRKTLSDGKDYYTLTLQNQDTGQYHFFARNTKEEIQDLVHQNLLPAEDAEPFMRNAKGINSIDKARRAWNKMFSVEQGGGRYLVERMMKVHDTVNNLRAKGMSESEIEQHFRVNTKLRKQNITPAMYRNYLEMEGRFTSEIGYVKDFLGELDQRLKPMKKGWTPKSHDFALQNYAQILDNELGESHGIFTNANKSGFLQVTVKTGKKQQVVNIDLTDQKTVQSGINNFLRANNSTKRNTDTAKYRLKQLLNEAKARGMNPEQVKKFEEQINKIENGGNPYVVVEELSGYIAEAAHRNDIHGIRGIQLSNPTKSSRQMKIQALEDKVFKQSVHNRAIEGAMPFHGGNWKTNGKGILATDPHLQGLINTHNSMMRSLRTHVGGTSDAIKMVSLDAEEVIGNVLRAYTKNGTSAGLVYDGKNKALTMVVAQAEKAKQIFGMTNAEDILSHPDVFTAPIGLINDKGAIQTLGTKRMARTKIFDWYGNKMILGTGFEEMSRGMIKRSNKATMQISEGKITKAMSLVIGGQRTDLERYSINNKYTDIDEVWKEDTRKSLTDVFQRTGFVDTAEATRAWYEWKYKTPETEKDYQDKLKKKTERMSADPSLSFFETLDKNEITDFHFSVDKFLSEHGLNTNVHNTRDTLVANAVRSVDNADVRRLLAGGWMDPMGRENFMKHGHYIPLDERLIRDRLARAGVSPEKIERMLSRGLTTDKADEKLAGELGYVNLNTAFLDDEQLAHRMSKAVASGKIAAADELTSTYEGGLIVRESAAHAFTYDIEKKITLSDGAELPLKLQRLLENDELFRDDGDGKRIMREEAYYDHTLRDQAMLSGIATRDARVGSETYGKLTVGVLAKDAVFKRKGKETTRRLEKKKDFYMGQNEFAWIKSYHEDDDGKKVLTIASRESVVDDNGRVTEGRKVNSSEGDRNTIQVRSDAYFDALGLPKEVDAINAYLSSGKEFEGAKFRSTIGLAVDAVKAGVDEGIITGDTIADYYGVKALKKKGYTVGKMTKDEIKSEAMSIVQKIMQDRLSIDKKHFISVSKNGIQLSENFGLEQDDIKFGAKGLHETLADVDKKLGTNMTDHDFLMGRTGYSVADVPYWQNQVGYTASRKGLVSWRTKEINAITARADEVLGKNNVVNKWMNHHMPIVAEGEQRGVKKYLQGVTQSVLEMTDPELQAGKKGPKAGSLLVKFEGDSFSYMGADGKLNVDPAGFKTGRMVNGVTEISANAIHDVPEKMGKDDVLTVGRYQKTILQTGQVELDINGNMKKMKDVIDANNGTYMVELPKDFHQDSGKYLTMVDQELVGIGKHMLETGEEDSQVVLKELQKAQLQLWRTMTTYNKEGEGAPAKEGQRGENFVAGQKAIQGYKDALNKVFSSAREGSLSRLSGGRLDMSGRFVIKGANPFVKGGGLENGTVVIGKKQFATMINGAEQDILEAVGGQHLNTFNKIKEEWDSAIEEAENEKERKKLRQQVYGKKLKNGMRTRGVLDQEASKLVLDYAKDNGLYGIMGRYPTIEKNTMRVVKTKWRDDVKGETMHMSLVTQLATTADNDGDSGNQTFAHYKKDASNPVTPEEMHKALGQIHEKDVELLDEMNGHLKAKILSDSASGRLGKSVDQITAGDIAKIDGFYDGVVDKAFTSKRGEFYDIESINARIGKSFVGVFDNMRHKGNNIAEAVWKSLDKQGYVSNELASLRIAQIEEFGRIISQDSISAKKFQYKNVRKTILDSDEWKARDIDHTTNEGKNLLHQEIKRRMVPQRYESLETLRQGIMEANVDKIREANKFLGMFKEGDEDIPRAIVHGGNSELQQQESQRYAKGFVKKQKFSTEDMLEAVQYTNYYAGHEAWHNSLFAKFGISEGLPTIEDSGNFLRGKDGRYFPSTAMEHVKKVSPEFSAVADEGLEAWDRHISSRHGSLTGDDNIFNNLDPKMNKGTRNTADMVDTMTVAEGAGVKLRQVVGKITDGLPTGFSPRGTMWGAAAFGAMWATSALTRSGPTPEGLQEQMSQPRAPQQKQSQPTARIVTNNSGEHINLSINAKDAQGLSRDQIAAMVQSELGAMTQTQMNMNLNVKDNTQDLSNSQWLQGFVSNALDKGFGF